MTHAPETGAINPLHFSGVDFRRRFLERVSWALDGKDVRCRTQL